MFKPTITIEKRNGEKIEVIESTTIKESKKVEREMKKKYNLIRHARHTVNYSEGIELYTNY